MADTAEEFGPLLARARQGDQEALAQLVRQYEFKVRLVARYLLGPALRPYLDSVDLTQSVHRSLIVGLRQDKFDLPRPENLMALALTMVRRKVARKWRHLQRQKRLDSGESAGGNLSQLLTTLAAPEADPARTVQFTDQVERLCAGLGETDRRLLELRLQGYRPAGIAEQLGLNVNAVNVRLSRLRQKLRGQGSFGDYL